MSKDLENDILYVCSLIEFIARATHNRRRDIIGYFSVNDIETLLKDAGVNHCMSFEEVADEQINNHSIPDGSFDTVSNCVYKVPSCTDIGSDYKDIVISITDGSDVAECIRRVFSSFLSDEISDFNSDVFYQNNSYLVNCYKAGRLL